MPFIANRRGLLKPASAAAAPPSGVWITVMTVTPNSPGNDSGNNGYTHISVIPLSAFSQTGGTQIRITFFGPSLEGQVSSAIYIGNGGGANAYAFGDTPVKLQVGGSDTITIAASSTNVVTDAANFVKDGTNTFIIASQLQNGSFDNYWKQGGANPGGGYSTWYKNAIDASTQAKSGYTDNSAASWLLMIQKIELYL